MPALQLVQVEFVPAGKVLTREGALPDQLVMVRQGAVQVTGGSLPGVLTLLQPVAALYVEVQRRTERCTVVPVLFVPAETTCMNVAEATLSLVLVALAWALTRASTLSVLGLIHAVPIDAGPGANFFLIELLLGQPSSTTVKATCNCTLWVSVHLAVFQVTVDISPDVQARLQPVILHTDASSWFGRLALGIRAMCNINNNNNSQEYLVVLHVCRWCLTRLCYDWQPKGPIWCWSWACA